MSLFVVVLCLLLLILVSAMSQWKLLVLLTVLFTGAAVTLMWYNNKLNRENQDIAERKIETVHIVYGSEKRSLLKDLEFQEILRKKHGLVIKGEKTDHLETPGQDLRSIDAFWPSANMAASIFKSQHPDSQYETKNIFNTPLVFYSWPKVTKFLIRHGVVKKKGHRYVMPDLSKFLRLGKRTWEDFRIPGLGGPIIFKSADPAQSTAGLLTAGITLIALNRAEITDEKEAEAHLRGIRKIFGRMGKKESSADILFNRYFKQGQSKWPIIAACENQVIEYYQTFLRDQDKIRKNIRVLKPVPGVLSEHPLVAITEKGKMLLTALCDAEIQQLAWKKFGFRSGVADIENDPGDLKIIGLSEQAETSVSMPSEQVMRKVLGVISTVGN